MIIRVDLVVEWTDKADSHYDNPDNKTLVLLNEIKSNLEFDGLFIIKSYEVYETNHE